MYKKFNQFKYLLLAVSIVPNLLFAQHKVEADSLLNEASLENVIQYALKHYPLIQQSLIDEETTNFQIKSKLADWYPQLNFNYNLLHNFVLQPSYSSQLGGVFRFGVINTSLGQFALSQTLFNKDVLLAAKSADEARLNTRQTTMSRKIDLTVNVTKAFYDVLATSQQIKVGQGDIVRLKQNLTTAKSQYDAGIVDKTDFKRATITLSNTLATLKSNQELLKYKIEYLKQLMGYPVSGKLDIVFDTLQMEREIFIDTTQQLDHTQRIEYKLYQTQRKLQEYNVKYNQWSFLPTASLNGFYNLYYLGIADNGKSNDLSELYKKNTPFSSATLNLSFPIFQGGKRIANIKQQKSVLRRLDLDISNFELAINSQYAQALAAYKANLNTYLTLRENVNLAKEVYDIIQLQYKSGVKNYLEVITAETDLRTARINYFNSLYGVLASKVDLQKALGEINY